MIVFSRAISRRMLLRSLGFSSCCVAVLNLSRNSSCLSSSRRASISLFSHSRISWAFIACRLLAPSGSELLVADHEPGPDRELRRGQCHRLARGLLVDPLQL